MKKLILLTLFVMPMALGPTQSPERSAQALAFENVTVIDVSSGRSRPNMTVVIRGDHITAVGPNKRVDVPNDARRVNGRGQFLIPGLWDMHVHFDKVFLHHYIANGVTGIRIMWGSPDNLALRKEVQRGDLLAPNMIIASGIVDGPNPIWPGSIAVSNESEARDAVRKIKTAGYDFVKVYSVLPRDAFFAIADEAIKQGITFAGHVPEYVSAIESSNAGQKSIEHLTGILVSCSTKEHEIRKAREENYSNRPAGKLPSPANLRPFTQLMLDTFSVEKANKLFGVFKNNHTWQCPTLTVLRSFAYLTDPNFTNDARLKYMPPAVRNFWSPSNDFRLKERTEEDFRQSKQLYQQQLKIVGMMERAGVDLLAGTDAMNPYCFPGFSLHDELALMVQAGLSPMDALKTATINPARYAGMEKTLGTIEKGKIADLVLLDADPLRDITNTRKINAVVLSGRLLTRSDLDKLLSDIEAWSRSQ